MSDRRGNSGSPTMQEIVEMAARGGDFTSYYTQRCVAIKPIRRVNVHIPESLLSCLDKHAAQLNLSREAAINVLLRRALARQMRPAEPEQLRFQAQSPEISG